MEKPDIKMAENFDGKSSASILNAIKNDTMTPSPYRDAVPDAEEGDIETLHSIGRIVKSNPDLQNAFVKSLINRIALTLIKSKSYLNPYRAFKRGFLEFGEIVEDIFVDLVKPHAYSPVRAEKEMLKRELPNILTQYYRMNSQAFYKVTVSSSELDRAFLTWNGVTDLIGRVVGRLLDSMEYDEFMLIKYLISKYILDGRFKTVEVTGDPTKDIISIKGVSNAILFPSVNYNPAGVLTSTERTDQYLFMSAEYSAVNDVEVLAKAFNMGNVEFLGHQVMFDNLWQYDYARMRELVPEIAEFTDAQINALKSVKAVLLDWEAFMIFDNLLESRQFENGEGLYWNHWLHSWKTLAMSPFANQIVFVAQEGEVTGLVVSPQEISAKRGDSTFFFASATITGIASAAVTWTVDSEVSVINSDGELRVAVNEPKTSLTVTATSKANPNVSATATVNLPQIS